MATNDIKLLNSADKYAEAYRFNKAWNLVNTNLAKYNLTSPVTDIKEIAKIIVTNYYTLGYNKKPTANEINNAASYLSSIAGVENAVDVTEPLANDEITKQYNSFKEKNQERVDNSTASLEEAKLAYNENKLPYEAARRKSFWGRVGQVALVASGAGLAVGFGAGSLAIVGGIAGLTSIASIGPLVVLGVTGVLTYQVAKRIGKSIFSALSKVIGKAKSQINGKEVGSKLSLQKAKEHYRAVQRENILDRQLQNTYTAQNASIIRELDNIILNDFPKPSSIISQVDINQLTAQDAHNVSNSYTAQLVQDEPAASNSPTSQPTAQPAQVIPVVSNSTTIQPTQDARVASNGAAVNAQNLIQRREPEYLPGYNDRYTQIENIVDQVINEAFNEPIVNGKKQKVELPKELKPTIYNWYFDGQFQQEHVEELSSVNAEDYYDEAESKYAQDVYKPKIKTEAMSAFYDSEPYTITSKLQKDIFNSIRPRLVKLSRDKQPLMDTVSKQRELFEERMELYNDNNSKVNLSNKQKQALIASIADKVIQTKAELSDDNALEIENYIKDYVDSKIDETNPPSEDILKCQPLTIGKIELSGKDLANQYYDIAINTNEKNDTIFKDDKEKYRNSLSKLKQLNIKPVEYATDVTDKILTTLKRNVSREEYDNMISDVLELFKTKEETFVPDTLVLGPVRNIPLQVVSDCRNNVLDDILGKERKATTFETKEEKTKFDELFNEYLGQYYIDGRELSEENKEIIRMVFDEDKNITDDKNNLKLANKTVLNVSKKGNPPVKTKASDIAYEINQEIIDRIYYELQNKVPYEDIHAPSLTQEEMENIELQQFMNIQSEISSVFTTEDTVQIVSEFVNKYIDDANAKNENYIKNKPIKQIVDLFVIEPSRLKVNAQNMEIFKEGKEALNEIFVNNVNDFGNKIIETIEAEKQKVEQRQEFKDKLAQKITSYADKSILQDETELIIVQMLENNALADKEIGDVKYSEFNIANSKVDGDALEKNKETPIYKYLYDYTIGPLASKNKLLRVQDEFDFDKTRKIKIAGLLKEIEATAEARAAEKQMSF